MPAFKPKMPEKKKEEPAPKKKKRFKRARSVGRFVSRNMGYLLAAGGAGALLIIATIPKKPSPVLLKGKLKGEPGAAAEKEAGKKAKPLPKRTAPKKKKSKYDLPDFFLTSPLIKENHALATELWYALQKMLELDRKTTEEDLVSRLSPRARKARESDPEKAGILWGVLVHGQLHTGQIKSRAVHELWKGIRESKKYIEGIDVEKIEQADPNTRISYAFHLVRLKAFEEELAKREAEKYR